MQRKFVLAMTVAAVSMAQTPTGGFGSGIGQKVKQNAQVLKHYTHKRRTEITLKGKSRGARVDLIRYVDGKMETVPLETPPRPAEGSRGRGLRGRIVEKKIEKKKEEMKEQVARLTSLVQRFSAGSDSMRAALEKATISRTGPGPDADVKIVATGVAKASDSFTLVWSVAHHRPAKVEIRAEADGKPVAITVEYASLPEGPFYPARTVISAPKKDLTVAIDTYDYNRSGDGTP